MKIETNAAAQYAALSSTPAKPETTQIEESQVLQEDTVSLSGASNNEQGTLGNGNGRMPPP